jgi:hypothetical protein
MLTIQTKASPSGRYLPQISQVEHEHCKTSIWLHNPRTKACDC